MMMRLFDYGVYVVVAVIVVILGMIFTGGNKGGPVLVLKKFNLNENEDEFLQIEGRASGLLSWILSLCGIDPVTSLYCNRQSIKFEETAIRYGKKTLNIPLVAVTAVSSGINKPFGLLVLGIVCALGGIIGAIAINHVGFFIIGLIIGALFIIFYVLRKTIVFSIHNGENKPIAEIRFKKSIIEGQNIDELKYESAANALNKAVLRIHYSLHSRINDIPVDKQNENKRQALSFTPNPENNKYLVTLKMKLFNDDYNFKNVIQTLNVNDIVVYIKQGRRVSDGTITAPMFYVETKEKNKGWCFSGHLKNV